MSLFKPIYAVVQRDLIKFSRQKGRVLSSLVRPLIWLVVIGAGFNSIVTTDGNDYFEFLVPGVLGMTILFGALLGSLSMVYEKESGVMRMILVSPLTHRSIVFAKMAAATCSAIIQATLLIVVLLALGYIDLSVDWFLLVVGMFILSVTCSGIGMLVASFSKTLDNFAAIMNFVIFPVFFLSGSLYPITNLPYALKVLAQANPYTYGVDILKHGILVPNGGTSDIPLMISFIVLIIFTIAAFFIASWRFSLEDTTSIWFPRQIKK